MPWAVNLEGEGEGDAAESMVAKTRSVSDPVDVTVGGSEAFDSLDWDGES